MKLPRVPRARAACALALAAAFGSPAAPAAPRAKPPQVRPDSAPDEVTYGRRDDVVAFATRAAEARGFDREWAVAQLAQARYLPSVARLVMPAATPAAKNWAAYRARFIEPQRIQAGVRWWQAQEPWLQQAQARWGVPPELVVAVVGVETFYGRITGHFKVIDALATLAFDFPAGRSDRSGFYRDELEAFLQWCAADGRDPQAIKGSYAGALGLPQFMPGTLLRYAVDFDDDGHIDLERSGADTVGSVAHFLAQHGWQAGLPTHYGVRPPEDDAQRAVLLAPDIVPSFTAAEFAERGAQLDPAGRRHEGPLALVQLFNGDAPPSYVAGTRNFYVVTRYNWSSYYALAVIELARALRAMRPEAPAPQPPAQAGSQLPPAASQSQP